MKALFLVLLFILTHEAWANKTGVGFALGNPSGLTAKHWLEDDKAIDGGLGMSFGKNTDLSIHSDYLLHNKGAFFFNDNYALDLYYGLGARLEFANDIEFGIRVPVGLAHQLDNQSADLFAEIAPVMDLFSKLGLEMHLLFGGRYYFQ